MYAVTVLAYIKSLIFKQGIPQGAVLDAPVDCVFSAIHCINMPEVLLRLMK